MSTTKRIKAPAMQEISRHEAETLLFELAQAESRKKELTGEIEQKIQKIRDSYATKIDPLNEAIEAKTKQLQFFAEKNKEDMFSKKKSLDLIHGVIGFRMGTPKLKTRKGFTWAAVLEMCKDKATEWIRTKEEINKELILSSDLTEEQSKRLHEVGIMVDADESFFIKLKDEEMVTA